ncbi:MAG: chemotaxis protein CheX [Syntrophobacter sp.]
MNVKVINPFLAAAMHVLKTMAGLDAKPGKPFLKKDDIAMGDVSAIISITGEAQGSMALVFTESCITGVASQLLGETFSQLNDEVKDAVGELTNMICGDARRRLAEDGINLQAGIPKILSGKSHPITHLAKGPRLAIPFETSKGTFIIEVALSGP